MPDVTKDQIKRWARRFALVGGVLGLLCPLLPVEYQAPCKALATICTGGAL